MECMLKLRSFKIGAKLINSKSDMLGFYFLFLTISMKSCYAFVSFPKELQTSEQELQSNGQTELSTCESSIIGDADTRTTNFIAEGNSCYYRIMATGDKVREIKVKMLNFGAAGSKEKSYVVYEGLITQGQPLGSICSESDVETIQQYHKNTLFIEYKNPLNKKWERFLIGYSFVEEDFTDAKSPVTTPSPVWRLNDSTLIGGPFCGESLHGQTILTSGNTIRLEFKTDVLFALKGLKAEVSLVLSRVCECEENKICIRQDYEKKCITGKHCTDNKCQNGGTCVQTDSTQTCYCPSGLNGDDCSTQSRSSNNLTFIVAPKDRSIKRDSGHTEECQVEVPQGETVEYYWTFNGVLIEAYNKRSGFGSYPGGVLQIDKFTNTLVGKYSCFATTSFGTAENTFEYRIVENCDVNIYPGPQSESKKINENAVVMCHVDSRAKEVRWKKNGVYIDFDKDERYRQLVNNYLHIRNIEMSDEGTYRCEAEDKYGCYSYKEGTLAVIDVKPLHKYCGISIHDEVTLASSRISQGYDAKPYQNPWHVIFRSRGQSRRHIAFGGGTLISQTFILTAAQNIKEFNDEIGAPWSPENVEFLLGTTSCDGIGIITTRTFKSFTVHPDYGVGSIFNNDIAVIELDSAVEYSHAIRPICIEPSDYIERVFFENSERLYPTLGKVTGCGQKRKSGRQADALQEVYLPYVDRAECEESLGSHSNMFTDTMFCAGSNIARMGDTCVGDAGGGLVMATSTRWVQTGIVSWGFGCDVNKYYGYYTDVGKFYDWIEGITQFSKEEVPDFLHS